MKVNALLEDCETRLSAFAPPVTDPARHVFNLVSYFCSEIQELVQGVSSRASLVHHHRKLYDQLKQDVSRTGLCFLPFVDKSSAGSQQESLKTLYNSNNDPRCQLIFDSTKVLYLKDVQERIQK